MSTSVNAEFRYLAKELPLFAEATRWKKYWVSRVAPFIKGDVLEAGAGIGANTRLLRPLSAGRYVCLEPDSTLAQQIEPSQASLPVETLVGAVPSLPREEQFDTVLYIDVLEHLERDAAEIVEAVHHIRRGGHLVVLSPASQLLYSPFDKAIGHFRRYTRTSLLRCSPPGGSVVRIEYLDSLGWILSLANRVLLRQAYPTRSQILFWDRWVVPISRLLDRLTGFRFGRSIVAIWRVEA